jgi:hypothetical protein
MNRLPVTSSYIESIGHEGETLEVAYKDGKVWKYPGVTADVFENVMKAESVGRALLEEILKAGYEGERIDEERGAQD